MNGERRGGFVLGMEGSANKIGIGIVSQSGEIVANVRETYVPPTGHGFLPRETAVHHQQHVVPLVSACQDQSLGRFSVF
jgi:N6-L-threonylcarbamoyladenine synthase